MPTINARPNTVSIIGTEVPIIEFTNNKHYAAHVSLKPIEAGDVVEIRLYIRVDATEGDGIKDFGSWDFTEKQLSDKVYVPWEPSSDKWKLVLLQTAGVPHTYKSIIYEAP